jgi:membrane protein implicated in regulation of membrane protease activity
MRTASWIRLSLAAAGGAWEELVGFKYSRCPEIQMSDWLDLLPMGSATLSLIFWGCLVFGLFMAMISFFFGEVLGFGLDAAEAGPISGPMIAVFLVLFGLGGIISREYFGFSGGGSIFGALVFSLVFSAAVYYGGFRLILSQQGGTDYNPAKTVGMTAKVITTIPEDGAGEISFDTNAGRISGPARSSGGKVITSGHLVNIDQYAAGIYMVSPLGTPPSGADNSQKGSAS